MRMVTLRFNTSRPVLVRDTHRLRSALVVAEYPAAFTTIRFVSLRCTPETFWDKLAITDACAVFVAHASGRAQFDAHNEFRVVIRDSTTRESIVSAKMIKDVTNAVIKTFDALPHTIRNENRRAMRSDSTLDVNIHHGYDYRAACLNWTKPAEGSSSDRMFPCFACNDWRNEVDFEWSVASIQEYNFTDFDLVLRRFECRAAPCCSECMFKRTHSSTLRPLKRHCKSTIRLRHSNNM